MARATTTPSPLGTASGMRAAYEAHAPAMVDVAARILHDRTEAQDVVHDVFLRLWARPRAFDAGRGEVGPYLRMVARSRALDRRRGLRTAQEATSKLERAVALAPPPGDEPHAEALHTSSRRALAAGLQRLPEAQREAVVLSHVAGLTAEAIATRKNLPVGTVKSRVRLGLSRLRHDPELLATAA